MRCIEKIRHKSSTYYYETSTNRCKKNQRLRFCLKFAREDSLDFHGMYDNIHVDENIYIFRKKSEHSLG